MSSSESAQVHASPWALDEFASPEIYPAMSSPSSRNDNSVESLAMSADDRANLEAHAYAQGVADGERAARSDAEQRVSSLLQSLNEAIESIRLHEARWISNAEENVAALAVGVARHIVQREIVTDAAVISGLVQRAVEQFPLDQTVTVRLSPEDHALCKTMSDGRTHDVQWIALAHIRRVGCLVYGRERFVDGRFYTALERLYRTIGQVQS
jgi:flagellar biosynthesis/type III secretory pathway protein FliH